LWEGKKLMETGKGEEKSGGLEEETVFFTTKIE
jgi:hypothetical protein